MAASGKELKETKRHIDEVKDMMPPDIWKFPRGVAQLVAEYAWDTPLQKPTLFSGVDNTLEKILYLVEYAGPLDQFKFYVTRLIKQELAAEAKKNILIDSIFTLADRQGPVMGLIVSGVDQTIRKEDGTEIDEGMAECFAKVVAELLPHRHQDVLAQARVAAPLEDEKAKQTREEANDAEMKKLFDAIRQNNEEVTGKAYETFKEFVENSKRRSMNHAGNLINNQYFLNLIHLTSVAFEVLARSGGELPAKNGQDEGRWYGLIADSFCFEIIGAILQLPSSARIKQILRSELYYVLNQNKKAARGIDHNGDFFRGAGTNYRLGVNSYYDDFGRACAARPARGPGLAGGFFKNYYEQSCQHPNFLLRPIKHKSTSQCLVM